MNNPISFLERDQVIEARREYMLSVVHHLYEYSKFELTDDMKQKIEKRVADVTILEAILSQVRIDSSTFHHFRSFKNSST